MRLSHARSAVHDQRLERVRGPWTGRRVLGSNRLLHSRLGFGDVLWVAKNVEPSETRVEQHGLRLELLQTSDTIRERGVERADIGLLLERQDSLEHRRPIAGGLPVRDPLTEPNAPAFDVLRDRDGDIRKKARELVVRGGWRRSEI